jgi:hypothetical protein
VGMQRLTGGGVLFSAFKIFKTSRVIALRDFTSAASPSFPFVSSLPFASSSLSSSRSIRARIAAFESPTARASAAISVARRSSASSFWGGRGEVWGSIQRSRVSSGRQ